MTAESKPLSHGTLSLALIVAVCACKSPVHTPASNARLTVDNRATPTPWIGARDTVAVSESALVQDSMAQMDTRRFRINGIALDQTEAEVKQLVGRPQSRSPKEYIEVLGDSVWSWTYADLTIGFLRGKVDRITCVGASCSTVDGVRVGDSWPHVHDIYGPSLPNDAPSQAQYWGRRCDCAMTLSFSAGKVAKIEIWFDES